MIATLTAEIYGRPGQSYEQLQTGAKHVRALLGSEARVVDVDDTAEDDQQKLVFVLDKEKASLNGINTQEIAYYKVRRYFERLMALNYDRVNITWYDIQYISDLERQPDGRYVGVITVYQRFEGTSIETGMNYKDTTKKDITIYVEKKQTQIAGRTIEFWDVMLGDVRVTETSA